jgi:DNA-binding response OmpR family regulator
MLGTALNPANAELRTAAKNRIWVIEHDGALGEILRWLFSSEGYEVDVVPDVVGGLERLRQVVPVAVVLDLLRPGSSGCVLCRTICELDSWSAPCNSKRCLEVTEKVLLLEMGADDYDCTVQSNGTACAFGCSKHSTWIPR